MTNTLIGTRRKIALVLTGAAVSAALPKHWSKPMLNAVVSPAHAQTSGPDMLCVDGTSTWLMTEYQENGVSFNQGDPQSQVQITITGNDIRLVTDWCIISTDTDATSRGRVTDEGTVDLTTGAASTNPVGSPQTSPTHGEVVNLANNLAQSFTLDCANSNSFVVRDDGDVYSFRLTRIS